MLGVHADITPQIARIDAKQGSDKISKYCYVNAILQTKADDFYTSRSPIQAGAELYGSNSIDADIEVIVLMLESLVGDAHAQTLTLYHQSIHQHLQGVAKCS
jgi:ATP phosphoribosyltransferase regulatory subunit